MTAEEHLVRTINWVFDKCLFSLYELSPCYAWQM